MTARPASIPDLTEVGRASIAHYRERERPPSSPLEWLGIAVAGLPQLTADARTADDVHWRSRTQSAKLRAPLLEQLAAALAATAATLAEARAGLLERHPGAVEADGEPEGYAELLEDAHTSAPRHAETMIAGYAAFLGAAIEAAGALADAELGAARTRRWERDDPNTAAALRATQLRSALDNALGGLLAYARLVAADSARLQD